MPYRHSLLALAIGCALLPCACVVYEPVPAYYPSASTYDRAWGATIGALEDVGVRVTSIEQSNGVVRGVKDGVDVVVVVERLPDGRTKVQFDAKSSQRDPALGERFSQAYERRMGR